MKRHDVYLTALDPTRGSELAKTRPCAIVSPNELNERLRTITIVPLTSVQRNWVFRVPVRFAGVDGEAALDQIRVVDKSRLVRRLGTLRAQDADAIVAKLLATFG